MTFKKLIKAASERTEEIQKAVQNCQPDHFVAMLGHKANLIELPSGFKPHREYLAFGCDPRVSLGEIEEIIDWYVRWRCD